MFGQIPQASTLIKESGLAPARLEKILTRSGRPVMTRVESSRERFVLLLPRFPGYSESLTSVSASTPTTATVVS